MKSAPLLPSELASLPRASLIEDRFGDVAVRLANGLWKFAETAPLPAEYVAKHYSPFSLLTLEAGDVIRWPEMAMSLPAESVLKCASGGTITKTARDIWLDEQGQEVFTGQLINQGLLAVVTTCPTPKENDQVSVPRAEALIDSIDTPEDALAVISALRTKFGLVGTEFTPEDVASAVETAMREAPAEVRELMTSPIIEAVTDDSRWIKLGDSLAERGNETVGDIAAEKCGLFASIPFSPSHALLVVSRDDDGEVVREMTLYALDSLLPEIEAGKVEGATSISVATAYRVKGGDVVHRDYGDAITVWSA